MHKTECVPENEIHEILWDFEILFVSQNPESQLKTRPIDLIDKKKILPYSGFCCPSKPLSENQSKW